MHLPVDGHYVIIRNKSLNNTFGIVRTDENGNPKPHQGWDIAAMFGSPVYAVADGVIEFIKDTGKVGYGKQICLSFNFKNGILYAFYAHLNSINVQAKQSVKEGERIGTVGQTGNADGQHHSQTHLHFEVRSALNPGAGLSDRKDPVVLLGAKPLTDIIFSDFPQLVK